MKGFSLFELCISLFILSIVLLGTDLLLYRTYYQNQSALFSHIATYQLNNMATRLIVLQTQSGFAEQIEQWNKQNTVLLPRGVGEVKGSFPIYQLSIYWGDRKKSCAKDIKGLSGCMTQKLVL